MNPYTSTGSVSTVASNIAGGSSSKNNVRAAGAPAVPLTTKQVTRRLMAYVRPHAASFATSFVSAGLSVVLQLYVPIVVGRAIDLIIGMGRVDFAALAPLLVQLALVVLAASALQWVQGYCVNLLTYRCVRDMRVDASEKIGRMPISFIDAHPHGDLISRVVNDVDQIGDGLLQGFNQLFTGVVTIVGTLLFMLSISVPMAVVVVLVTPLSIMAATLIAKFSNKSFAAQQRIQGQLGAHIEEYVGSQRLVSTFCYGDRAQERFDTMNGELYTAGERAQFLSSLSNPGTRFINNLIYAAVAVIGCMCVITGWPAPLTVGGVQTFLSYANQYTKPFNEVTNVITQLQTAYASARRLFALLDADEESPEKADREALAAPAVPSVGSALPAEFARPAQLAGPASSARGEVVFDHVNFSYTPERPLLQDICIHAAPGQRIALVGPTGCGKTTLINLLLRFYDVQGGRIELDGVDIASYARADLRSRFGMVLQDTWLFEGTVPMLERLKEAGLPLAVVTSKRHEVAMRGLDLFGLTGYFDFLIGSDDWPEHKPHPGPVAHGCERLGLAPQTCLYVGDSPFDMQSGSGAGCATAAALWGMFPQIVLEAERPTYVCAHGTDVPPLLGC